MSDPTTPPGQLVWAALPNGRGADPASTLKVSVLLSPRLVPAAVNTTLADGLFAPMADWPAAAAGLAFSVDFAAGPASGVVLGVDTRPDTRAFDSATWAALMRDLRVDAHPRSATALGGAACESFPAGRNYQAVVAGYRPDPSVLPDAPIALPGSDPAAAATTMRRVARHRLTRLVGATVAEREQVRAQLQQLRSVHTTVSARHIDALDSVVAPQLLFAQMNDYFDELSAAAGRRYAAAQANPPQPPSFDIHAAISAISRYPLLMRKLALVLDLLVTLPAGTTLPAAGVLRVRPNPGVGGWPSASPWTRYTLDGDAFRARPDDSDPLGLRNGLMDRQDIDTAMGLDLDALPHGIRAMALQVHRDVALGTAGAEPLPPAPRSAGLSLTRDGTQDIVTQLMQRQAANEAALGTVPDGSSVTLAAEDLMRGYRVDVRRAGETAWRSLHWRRGQYTRVDQQPIFTAPLDDEGCATLRVFNPDTTPSSSKVWTHETLFRWTGWSLSAPKPGRTLGAAGTVVDDTPDAGNVPLRVRFEPVPGTLPRLRFGVSYECRLRTVDLAGNGPDPAAVSDERSISQLGTYLRFDPLVAPALRMRDAAQPAESVDHIVLRSAIDTPTSASNERLVAPPRSSVQMAEWHGMFDTPTGLDPSAQATFAALDGDLADQPYGASPPTLPYLPDPLARGACLRLPTVNGAPPSEPTKVPFIGSWPALQPWRLRLREGDAAPSFDASQSLFDVPLPKGRMRTYELTSHFDAGSLDPNDAALDQVKDLALFDYWHHVEHTPKLRKNRAALWAEIDAARNDQLTPPRLITLVHAVPRPVTAPVLDPARVLVGRIGTVGSFLINAAVDVPSTAAVELQIDWDEPVDDGVAAPHRIAASATVGRQSLDYADGPGSNGASLLFQHEFHDTRHRQINCRLVATTRYREYFPEITDPTALTQVSNLLSIDLPAAVAPLPPKLLYVMPIYAWDDSGEATAPRRQRRSGLRIYLDRPWYSSGDGELLGVVMPMKHIDESLGNDGGGGGPPGPPGPPRPFRAASDPGVTLFADPPTGSPGQFASDVSQWGTDPIFTSAAVPSPFTPLPQHFANVRAIEYLFQPPSNFGGDRIWDRVVAGFDVQFDPPDATAPERAADPQRDPNNGRWYCDLELSAGAAYMPMVHLALVRFQPHAPNGTESSYPDPRFSAPVMADFVQLAPDRSASVVGVAGDATQIDLSVSGPGHGINTATDSTARPEPRLTVDVEIDIGDAGQTVWISTSTIALTRSGGGDGTSFPFAWQGRVALPFARGTRPLRLVLREFERLPADAPSRIDVGEASVTLAERLVYCDVLAL